MRLKTLFKLLMQIKISIHASHAGCDFDHTGNTNLDNYFNPRIPCGMRPSGQLTFGKFKKIFQSTHPMRDATVNFDIVILIALYFNPRIPCGMRRKYGHAFEYFFQDISIHASHAGCDMSLSIIRTLRRNISIHASHAGCDDPGAVSKYGKENFNPRIPCGMRPGKRPAEILYRGNFNPRIPCGMRLMSTSRTLNTNLFQSTHPMRDATIYAGTETLYLYISIHASHAGCDVHFSHKSHAKIISIHASHAGCDLL